MSISSSSVSITLYDPCPDGLTSDVFRVSYTVGDACLFGFFEAPASSKDLEVLFLAMECLKEIVIFESDVFLGGK